MCTIRLIVNGLPHIYIFCFTIEACIVEKQFVRSNTQGGLTENKVSKNWVFTAQSAILT